MKIVIANTEIHQDAEGRFSLNDLHRASGGEDKNKPSNFLRSEQTQKLIKAINRCSDSSSGRSSDSMSALSTKEGGKNQGSYGVKELVYAYANWISADFYLRMIRTFDAVATGKIGINQQDRALTQPQQLAIRREIRQLMQEIKRETNPAVRRTLYAQLEHDCRLVANPCPALEEMGNDALPDHENPALEVFWEVVDALEQSGHTLNHARDKNLIALNLPQVSAASVAARMALPDPVELRLLLRACRAPRFIAVKAVNSAHSDATVKCWVFETRCDHTDDMFGGAS